MPSVVGTYEHTTNMPVNQAEDVEMAGEDGPVIINTGEAPKTKLEKRIICGASALNFKRDNMQIEPLYQQDGMSKYFQLSLTFILFLLVNFDYLEQILEHSLVNNLKVPLKDTPLIFTENAVHNKELRRKLTEYMFET